MNTGKIWSKLLSIKKDKTNSIAVRQEASLLLDVYSKDGDDKNIAISLFLNNINKENMKFNKEYYVLWNNSTNKQLESLSSIYHHSKLIMGISDGSIYIDDNTSIINFDDLSADLQNQYTIIANGGGTKYFFATRNSIEWNQNIQIVREYVNDIGAIAYAYELANEEECEVRVSMSAGYDNNGRYFSHIKPQPLSTVVDDKEFEVGDVVTLDRYNHIDDMQLSTIIGYGEKPLSHRLTYQLDCCGVTIESTGVSIKESKYYTPVPLEDRHAKIIK